jgi:predicted HAD superfamily hydrolase
MKKILYYVEAWSEISPDFRFGAFKDAVYQIKILKEHAPDLDCRLLIGETIQDVTIINRYNEHEEFPVAILRNDDLKKIYKDGSVASHAFMSGISTDAELIKLSSICRMALGDFEPDVVLMHETHAPFLGAAFPNALLLHSMYGMTYRMPYPRLTLFDHQGLYQNSLLATHAEIIRDLPLPDVERRLLASVRNWFATQIVPHDPAWRFIEPYQSRYDKLVLVPLQVDGYFAFSECSNYSSQLEFLEDVLRRAPNNWGIIVTEHSEYNSFIDEFNLNRLRRLYPNLIYSQDLGSIPYVSQALLPHVDCVVSVSSSVALQSMIFDCAVVAAGESHINAVATCTLDQLPRCFELHEPGSRDGILHFLLTRYHNITAQHVHDGAGLFAFLAERYEIFCTGATGLEMLPTRSLSDVFKEIKSHSQWRAWTEELRIRNISVQPHPVLARIVFNEAISFDLFDTLVNRPFVEPHELFQFLETIVRERTENIYLPFYHVRREAERRAREVSGHRVEVTLKEIYAQMEILTGFSSSLLDEIYSLELQVEMALIGSRRSVVRAWNMAKHWGKIRTIITDIYIEECHIRNLLSIHKIDDFDFLFVSATERVRKDDGSVYPEYLSKLRQFYPGIKTCLHIGDNFHADGKMAQKFGIETVIIPKSIDYLRQTELGNFFHNAFSAPSFDSSIIVGMIANRFFSAPTSSYKKNSLCDGSLFNIGYAILGPFVLGYVQWVIRRMQSHQIDHAYFLARDGYLIMKVYEALKRVMPDLPSHTYLFCSRRSVVVPSISDERDIFEIASLNFGSTTAKNFLKSRYGLRIADMPPEVLRKHGIKADGSTLIAYPRDLALIIHLVSDLKPYILEKAEAERVTYLRYLKQEGVCDAGRRSALIDIGYSGTMQRKISKLTGLDYSGYYMMTHNYVTHHFRSQIFEAWLGDYDSQRAPYNHPFNQYIPLIESLLSSTEGSLVNFQEKEGELYPDYLYASNEIERRSFVEGAHAGALVFVDEYIRMFGQFAKNFEFSPHVSSFPILQFASGPTEVDAAVFEGLILENMFAGAEFAIIAGPHNLLDARGSLSVDATNYLLNKSKWKQGARVVYNAYKSTNKISDNSDKNTDNKSNIISPKSANNGAGINKPYIKSERDMVDINNMKIASEADIRARLLRKLRNDPQRFFADSRFKMLRWLRHFFGQNNIGKICTRILRALLWRRRSYERV